MPKKKGARSAQKPMLVASDYDTDPTGDYNPVLLNDAAPSARTNEELNTLVLKRWYPEVQHILTIAHFAVVYSCNPETQEWEKCDTQGSLFVCQLSPHSGLPRYKVIILNRKNMENFELNLVSTESLEVTDDFIICSSEDKEANGDAIPHIFGIWMYKEAGGAETRDNVVKCIMDCARLAEQHARIPVLGQKDRSGQFSDPYESDPYAAGLDTQPAISEPPQLSQSTTNPVPGKQIDIATLFANSQHISPGKASARGGGETAQDHTRAPDPSLTHHHLAASSQQQRPLQDQRQTTLLDLFKSSGRG